MAVGFPLLRALGMAVLVAAAISLSGCASTQMKGTPFYTGEYEAREGPAADRVNLWPLLYYRDPALSVLWPLGEFTPDHLAVRPLFSVYGRQTEEPVYNMLWPLMRFQPATSEYRVVNLMRDGDDWFFIPIGWYTGHPFQEDRRGSAGLFPLWMRFANSSGSSTHVAWPLINSKDMNREKGWRVWPLAGAYQKPHESYRYALWPLGRQWTRSRDGASGSYLLPFYVHERNSGGESFFSLPYSWGSDTNGASWGAVVPLFGTRSTPAEKSFYSLLYSAGTTREGDASWRMVTPLWFQRDDADSSLRATLLGGYARRGQDLTWAATPLLAFGKHSEQAHDVWAAAGLYRHAADADGGTSHLFPLYHYQRDGEDARFLSLPWSSGRSAKGAWQLALPLYYHRKTPATETSLTPLLAFGTRDGGQTHWRSLVPLLYFDRRSEDSHLVATPLGGFEREGKRLSWLFAPLLSGGYHHGDVSDVWLLGPLARRQVQGERRRMHLLPFYYGDSARDMHLSPLYARWRDGDATRTVVPPLLAAQRVSEGEHDLFVAAGLAGMRRKDGRIEEGYAVPLAWYKRGEGIYTPIYGHKQDDFRYWATPLVGTYEGDRKGFWLFPLFSHRRDADGVSGRTFWSEYRFTERYRKFGLWPLYSYRHHEADPDDEVPAYGRTLSSTRAGALFLYWYRNRVHQRVDPESKEPVENFHRSHGLFPLWSYRRDRDGDMGRTESDTSVLLKVFDSRQRVRAAEGDKDAVDYRRRRILWRLWHYEREAVSDTTSVDIFPGLTYDRHGDSFKKFSLLWRFIRYERDEHGTDLDLLFIPLKRGTDGS